jgi:hypothetical protein
VAKRRSHSIDAAGVIAEFPGTLMIPPRQGLRPVDADQIRLSLAGIGQCEGSADDDERFTRLIRWFAERDLDYDPPSSEEKLQVTPPKQPPTSGSRRTTRAAADPRHVRGS